MNGVLARKEGVGCWHVLLTHMPLYNDNIWNSEPCRQMWEPVLTGAAIDLELSGHDHTWKLLRKGKTYEITFNGHYPDQQDVQKQEVVLHPALAGNDRRRAGPEGCGGGLRHAIARG